MSDTIAIAPSAIDDAADRRRRIFAIVGSSSGNLVEWYDFYCYAFFALTIKNFRSGSPPRGCPTTRGLMELTPGEGEGLDDDARQAFADLMTRITGLIQEALSDGAKRGEFKGDPETAALHIATVTRGLAVLERAFGNEAQLRKIAAHTVDLVLGRGSR